MQKIAHPDGEIGVVKAVEQMGSVYTLSIFSTCTIEEVAAAAPKARKWFQLSIFRQNRNIATELVQRAEAAGFEAIVLTVDFPIVGRRRNRYELPEGAKLANLPALDFTVSKEDPSFVYVDASMPDQTLTWEDLKWLQSVTKLPFVLKGILCPEDARLAVEYGAKAIFVSNHGGRQHDSVLPTIDALPGIVKEVGGRCDIYVDGGITTGSDVFKALALGADMAFIGRPALWGLAVGGQGGATRVLEILRDELDVTMALSGISNVAEIDSKYIARHPYSPTERRH
jgi:(S)-2-hydroxy-acid oxidase